MYLQFINQEFSELTPEEKYFCAIFLKNFGVDRISSLSVKEFALEFGMTTHLITKTINRLKKCGYISLQTTAQRQARRYKAGSKLKRLPEQDKEECEYKHKELIDRVLSNAPLKGKEAGKSNLKIQSKLLLIVLLLSANKFGGVESLSRPDLQRLTGMDSDRVKSHIKKLVLAGYITHHLPGTTNHSLFGLCKGTYILNIDLLASNTRFGPIAIELESASLTKGELYQKLRSVIHAKLDAQSNIKAISQVFPKSPQNELLAYIEFKHGVYVLSILRLLAAEKKAKRETIYAELQDTIQADLFPASHVISEYKLPSTKKLRDLMTECVFDASLNVAKAIMESSWFKECYVSVSQPKYINFLRFVECIYHLRFLDLNSVILHFTTSHITDGLIANSKIKYPLDAHSPLMLAGLSK